MVFSLAADFTALINKNIGESWRSPFIVESKFAAAFYSKFFVADNKVASRVYCFFFLAWFPTRLSFEMRQAKIQQGVIWEDDEQSWAIVRDSRL